MKKQGRGIACMWYPIGFTGSANPSGATVMVNEDGTAILLTGTVEIGQGSLTVLGQIAAEELGIGPNDVTVVSADTNVTPMDTGPIASRTTYVTGNAVRMAASQTRKKLFETAALMLDVTPEHLEVRDHEIRVLGFPKKSLSIASVARERQVVLGKPTISSATYNPKTVPLDPDRGQGKPFNTYVYATQIAEVEVDTETGEVDVLRIVAAHDCGTPINPTLVEGQIEGGIATGIGFALTEEIVFQDGKQINPRLSDYVIPTALDMPKIEAIIVDNYDPTGPFGAKGVGEPTLVPTAPAILNAIYDAIGVRLYSLPATPENVLKAIHEKREQTASNEKGGI